LRPEGAEGAATWLAELVWRDFYFMILDRFPHVVERAFKPAYDAIAWEQGPPAEQAFAAWCAGVHRLSAGRRRDAPDQPALATCTTACACWSLRF
jgi:hypothetical protein